MSLKVYIDHQIFSLQQFGGISRYFAGLSHGLNKHLDINHHIHLLYSENAYLFPSETFSGRGIFKKLLKLDGRRRIYKWNSRLETYRLAKNKFDVFHPTYYDPYYLDLVKKPSVITIHDMIHERFPHFFSKNDDTIYRKSLLATRANHIVAISENTKKDIMEYLHVPEQKISVVQHGLFINPFSNDYHKDFDNMPFQANSGKFILFVGSRETYKNFIPFLKAVAHIIKAEEDLYLFCAGGGNFTEYEKSVFFACGITHKLLQADLADHQLSQAYRNALLFAFPSLYEGFGLPILEAFANDCPVAVSNTSSFPEIGDDAVAYFDPCQAEDMAAVILKLIDDSDYRFALIEKGRKRLVYFGADTCLERTIAVYKQL